MKPASTVVHVASPAAFIVPLGHRRQRLAPAPENRPAGQAVCAVAPAMGTEDPPLDSTHVAWPLFAV